MNLTCPQGAFLCKSEKSCISSLEVCDGVQDCLSNEDEDDRNCQNLISFHCQSGNKQIPQQMICDFKYDCPDLSDEIYCSKIFFK